MSEIKLFTCKWRNLKISCVSPAIITARLQSVKGLPVENKNGKDLERPPAGNKLTLPEEVCIFGKCSISGDIFRLFRDAPARHPERCRQILAARILAGIWIAATWFLGCTWTAAAFTAARAAGRLRRRCRWSWPGALTLPGLRGLPVLQWTWSGSRSCTIHNRGAFAARLGTRTRPGAGASPRRGTIAVPRGGWCCLRMRRAHQLSVLVLQAVAEVLRVGKTLITRLICCRSMRRTRARMGSAAAGILLCIISIKRSWLRMWVRICSSAGGRASPSIPTASWSAWRSGSQAGWLPAPALAHPLP